MSTRVDLLLFSQASRHIEGAMECWLKRNCHLQVYLHPLPSEPQDIAQFPAWIAETFSEIAGWIEQLASEFGGAPALREFAAYIEAYDPGACGWEDFWPLHDSRSPRLSLISMLVLAFPEIHWIFYSPYSLPTTDGLMECHFLLPSNGLAKTVRLQRAGFVALFDPEGLRELIHGRLRQEKVVGTYALGQLPKRTLKAVALDEEPEYAFFTGYLAYRFGYRTWSISSFELMKSRLKKHETFALSLEDLFLAFPDRSYIGESLSDLKNRYQAFPALRNIEHRVLITVGRETGAAGGWSAASNREFLQSQGGSFRVLYKPLTGIFETAQKANIKKSLEWPPPNRKVDQDEPHAHSAPGRMLTVAHVLLARAQILLNSSPAVQDAIHAAVLALDAKELLGGRTPTLALKAIALQQEAEVAAESLFLGVQHNLDVRQRLRDIHIEVTSVMRWVHHSQKQRAALNARLIIAEQLAKRYHDRNQIEEEAACLAEGRTLRFDFWVREKRLRWLVWPFLKYLAFSLSSISRFVAVVLIWTLFFGASYYVCGMIAHKCFLGFWDATVASARLFVTGNAVPGWEKLGEGYWWGVFWTGWITFQSIISFINLGLLLSHIYMLVSRR